MENQNRKKETPSWVEVDGVQVFSADFVFEQMQAQSCRIDLVHTIVKICGFCSGAAFLLSMAILLKVLL